MAGPFVARLSRPQACRARGARAISQMICGVARCGVIGKLWGSGQISSWIVANPDISFWNYFRIGGQPGAIADWT